MKRVSVRASYACAAVALGLLAFHFNAGQLPGWTRSLAALAGAVALLGTGLAAFWLGRSGWTQMRNWPGQVAFALNGILALAFVLYASPE
jgi:hypothetical protein